MAIRNHHKLQIAYQYFDYKLFSRHCDICKDFRPEIPAIHSETVEKIQIWPFYQFLAQ